MLQHVCIRTFNEEKSFQMHVVNAFSFSFLIIIIEVGQFHTLLTIDPKREFRLVSLDDLFLYIISRVTCVSSI